MAGKHPGFHVSFGCAARQYPCHRGHGGCFSQGRGLSVIQGRHSGPESYPQMMGAGPRGVHLKHTPVHIAAHEAPHCAVKPQRTPWCGVRLGDSNGGLRLLNARQNALGASAAHLS